MDLTIDQALQKGVEAHKAGQVQEADRLYTAILKAQPKHPDANHNMGVLAVGVGKVQEALPFFKTALESNPNTAQFWLSYIDALIKLDQIADAKAVFDQAKSNAAKGDGFDQLEQRLNVANKEHTEDNAVTETLETNQSSTLDAAIELREAGKFSQAIELLKDGISQFSRDVDMLALLSHCHILEDDLEEATLQLDKAKSLDPDNASVNWNKVRLLLRKKDITKALALARHTNERFPNDIEGMGVFGSCLRANNNIEESLVYLNKAVELNPNYAEAFINRGLIHLSKENKIEALLDLESAYELKPYMKQIWNFVINLKIEFKQFPEAIQLLTVMTKSDPTNEKNFANMALCHQRLAEHEKAIELYNKALAIKPDYVEVYLNLGNLLKEQGKPEEAIEAYNKALAIKPDYAEAYSNMGIALQQQGKPEEAIKAYKNAIAMKPDNAEAWNNIFFSLQAMKTQISSDYELCSHYPEVTNFKYTGIAQSILHYRLNRGGPREGSALNKALGLLSTADNISIKNPTFNRNSCQPAPALPTKIVALVHFGRSGTGLLHSLIDGQPEVSTLPSIYLSEYFDYSTWEKITEGGGREMADRLMAIYDVLFDASSGVSIATNSKKLIYNIGQKEGMANVGEQRDEVLRVDRTLFRTELNSLMTFYDELDAFLFFKLAHAAYDSAINDMKQKSIIFYHIHNPDTYAQLNFLRSAPDTKWLMIVREPIQSCESWVHEAFREMNHPGIANKIIHMLYEVDNPVFQSGKSVGLRLEDLKAFPKKTIPTLCAWLGIKEEDSLYEMTAQGKKWWGNPSSPDYAKDGMDPFGKTSIKRKVGSVFSENDQFILRTLFYPFSVRFSYVEENAEQFEIDLQMIRPMLDEMFDFEKTIAERTQAHPDQFMKSGSYLYLRAGLIERWNTLNKFGTYPNMIKPLELD